MRISRATYVILLGSAFFLTQRVHPQTSSQVKRIQADWQSFKSSQESGNRPVYPPLAVATKIEGGVRLDFVISTDGTTKDIALLSGHPLLVQSAIDAVRSWRFKPTVLGDTAVEVETIATIGFFLPGHDPSTFLAPYRKNVEKNPNGAKEHRALGRQLLNVGEPGEAAVEFQKAISLEPQEAGAHFDLGEALAAKGDLDTAVSEYRKGLSMNPNATNAHYDLARSLERKGDLDGALAEYRLGLQLQPKEGNRHYGFGLLLMKKKDVDAAVIEYRLALQNRFDTPVVHYELGRALEEKGDLAAAEKEYQKAAKDMPQNETYRQAHDRVANHSHP
ncbi:MAG: TonB family protein [Candidatus Acidiferrum sp.]